MFLQSTAVPPRFRDLPQTKQLGSAVFKAPSLHLGGAPAPAQTPIPGKDARSRGDSQGGVPARTWEEAGSRVRGRLRPGGAGGAPWVGAPIHGGCACSQSHPGGGRPSSEHVSL